MSILPALILIILGTTAFGENLSDNEFFEIKHQAQRYYANEDCLWNNEGAFEKTGNQMYRLDQNILVRLSCVSGNYNESSVWLNGLDIQNLNPIYFSIPSLVIDYKGSDKEEINDIKVKGFYSVSSLYNASFDKESLSISNQFLGRAKGDTSSGGVWNYEGNAFVLKYYDIDVTSNGIIDPWIVYQ